MKNRASNNMVASKKTSAREAAIKNSNVHEMFEVMLNKDIELRTGFTIIRITEFAKYFHPQIYKYKDSIIGAIQKWYDELPAVSENDSRKVIKIYKFKFAMQPSQAMSDYYGYWSKKGGGCLLSVELLKPKRK